MKQKLLISCALLHRPEALVFDEPLTGLEFEPCYESRVTIELQGATINFIDLESFKKNKKAVGRHQDLADLENLENN